jgi:hypothetical protein
MCECAYDRVGERSWRERDDNDDERSRLITAPEGQYALFRQRTYESKIFCSFVRWFIRERAYEKRLREASEKAFTRWLERLQENTRERESVCVCKRERASRGRENTNREPEVRDEPVLNSWRECVSGNETVHQED